METKFKIGDKVVCGDPGFARTFGKTGTVIEISSTNGTYYVDCGNGSQLPYFDDELTLAEASPSTPEWDGVFRVGDKGKTRGGDPYLVARDDEEDDYPLWVEFGARGSCFTRRGTYWANYGESPHDL